MWNSGGVRANKRCRDGATYTYTGNNSVAHTNEPVAFEVIPTEVFAVA